MAGYCTCQGRSGDRYLPIRKLIRRAVGGVGHVVVDGVLPGLPDVLRRIGAGGLLGGARVGLGAARGGALPEDVEGGVGDVVPRGHAAALERVEEAEEMPHFVHRYLRADVVRLTDALEQRQQEGE